MAMSSVEQSGYSGMNHAWTMRQVSQDRYEFKQSKPYIWSLAASRPRRHPINAQCLMGTSWRLCWVPQGRKLFMEGGFVCEWQVASCSERSPSAKHVRTRSRVDTLQDLKDWWGWRSLVGMASITRGSTKYSRVTLAMSKNVNLSQGLSTALMSWRVTMGSIGRPPWTTKIWSMQREGSNRSCSKKDPQIFKL